MPTTIPKSRITTREIRKSDWKLIEKLFGERGACGGCWCMHWRREKGGKAWEAAKGAPNRRAFKVLVESGQAHGVLAFDGATPVGWCAFGRRSEFPRLVRTRAYQYVDSAVADGNASEVWSINCLFVLKSHRDQGISQAMVATAIEAIRKRHGRFVEAYPVTLTADGNKLPAAFAYTGPEIIFRRLGFKEVQRLSQSRPLYRLELGRRG